MNMQVIDTLGSVRAVVNDRPESSRNQPFLVRYLLCGKKKVTQQSCLILAGIGQAIETVFIFRDDKEMHRS